MRTLPWRRKQARVCWEMHRQAANCLATICWTQRSRGPSECHQERFGVAMRRALTSARPSGVAGLECNIARLVPAMKRVASSPTQTAFGAPPANDGGRLTSDQNLSAILPRSAVTKMLFVTRIRSPTAPPLVSQDGRLYPLISRAVASLDRDAPRETRRTLYKRACSAQDLGQSHLIMHSGIGGITPITGGLGKYCVVTCTSSALASPNSKETSFNASSRPDEMPPPVSRLWTSRRRRRKKPKPSADRCPGLPSRTFRADP